MLSASSTSERLPRLLGVPCLQRHDGRDLIEARALEGLALQGGQDEHPGRRPPQQVTQEVSRGGVEPVGVVDERGDREPGRAVLG